MLQLRQAEAVGRSNQEGRQAGNEKEGQIDVLEVPPEREAIFLYAQPDRAGMPNGIEDEHGDEDGPEGVVVLQQRPGQRDDQDHDGQLDDGIPFHLADGDKELVDQLVQRSQEVVRADSQQENDHVLRDLPQPQLDERPGEDEYGHHDEQENGIGCVGIVSEQFMEVARILLRCGGVGLRLEGGVGVSNELIGFAGNVVRDGAGRVDHDASSEIEQVVDALVHDAVSGIAQVVPAGEGGHFLEERLAVSFLDPGFLEAAVAVGSGDPPHDAGGQEDQDGVVDEAAEGALAEQIDDAKVEEAGEDGQPGEDVHLLVRNDERVVWDGEDGNHGGGDGDLVNDLRVAVLLGGKVQVVERVYAQRFREEQEGAG